MKPLLALTVGVALLISFVPGCGSDAAPESRGPGGLGEAGPNRRLRLKDEYKQAIDKNGHLILKPGMKKPDFAAKPSS